jgi:hypothetical protein
MNKHEIIRFYQLQLVKFRKLQAKNIHYTEFGARISDVLIGATERRLNELKSSLTIAIFDKPVSKNGEANGRI